MVKITSNILFVAWFGTIIILDKVGTIFHISDFVMNIIILAVSAIIVYVIYKVNMNEKKNKIHYDIEYTIKKKEKVWATNEEDAKIKLINSYNNNSEIDFMSIKKIDKKIKN
jgi:hypothetical protein